MKDRVRPTSEAVERVRHQGERAVLAFLDEVSSISSLVEYLPSVPGFRKNSDAGIKQQKLSLAKRLTTKSNDEDRAHFAFYSLWRSWASEHLGDPDVDRMLDELEEREPAPGPDTEAETWPFEARVIGLFTTLKNLSVENKCTREAIERFFTFSPFSTSDGLRDVINSAKTAVEVERDSGITALSRRLRKDEEEIQQLKSTLQSFSTQLPDVVSDITEVARKVADLRTSSRATAVAADEIRVSLNDALARVKANADTDTALTRDLAELRREVRAQHSERDGHRARLDQTLTELETRLRQAIAVAVAPLDQKLTGISPVGRDALDSVAHSLDRLAAQVTSLSRSAISRDELHAITERIVALEHGPATAAHSPSADEQAAQTTAVVVPWMVRPLPKPRHAVKTLDSVTKIAESLNLALQSLGLKKTAAEILAEEITAAMLANQTVFFKGSLGAVAAQLCAVALSGENAWRFFVPIGLTEDDVVRMALGDVAAKSATAVPSLVLEGLNRSSFDVTKDVLAEFTIDQEISAAAKVFCFVTLGQGLASLPTEPEYLELGPTFDLDHLDWRGQPDRSIVPPGGTILRETEHTLRTRALEEPVDTDEAARLLGKFLRKRNVRMERAILTASRTLQHVRRAKTSPTALQSLAFGWLIPLWLAGNVTKDEADSELDGGKLDSEKGVADPRIASILAAGEFGSAKAGEPQ